MEWVEKCARAELKSGAPEQATPGLWNNVSLCCGPAGIAEMFTFLGLLAVGYLYILKRRALEWE
jgi:NADH:ubiquinone oxidoreductase subunit 3 (subunit A)